MAQQRALAAGMRIGLYLDLAVGVAPDGADTWSQPDTVVSGARIGCPPDMFNENGQDWGLAPLSPTALKRAAISRRSRRCCTSSCAAPAPCASIMPWG